MLRCGSGSSFHRIAAVRFGTCRRGSTPTRRPRTTNWRVVRWSFIRWNWGSSAVGKLQPAASRGCSSAEWSASSQAKRARVGRRTSGDVAIGSRGGMRPGYAESGTLTGVSVVPAGGTREGGGTGGRPWHLSLERTRCSRRAVSRPMLWAARIEFGSRCASFGASNEQKQSDDQRDDQGRHTVTAEDGAKHWVSLGSRIGCFGFRCERRVRRTPNERTEY